MLQNSGPGHLNFTLPTNKAMSEEDTEQMKEIGENDEELEDELSSSNTLSVSAVDEDDLQMLNQALTREQGSLGSNDLEEEKVSVAATSPGGSTLKPRQSFEQKIQAIRKL